MMVSKTRAFIYSLGAPLLYMLIYSAVLMAYTVYLMAAALINGTFPVSDAEVLEFTNVILDELIVQTLPTLLISGVLFLAVLFFVHRKKSVSLWKTVGITKNVSARTLILAALAGLSFNVACLGFIEATPVPQNWIAANETVTQSLINESNILLSIIMVCIFVPFVEEVIFRGFTQRILHHALLPWMAVIIQGIIFGIFHANALQTIYACATGILVGYIYMKTQNLWATIVFHMAYNSANFPVNIVMYMVLGEDGKPGILALALMAAGGTTLALLCARSIKRVQKAME